MVRIGLIVRLYGIATMKWAAGPDCVAVVLLLVSRQDFPERILP